MRKRLPLLALATFLLASFASSAQSPPKREMRGAWVATFGGIDWPVRTQTPAQQQAALITILDHHKATGINTIYLQVRSQCDAMYASTIEPWSRDLTNVQGTAPSPLWDPLQFAINECRKRNMELHAWLNPYRAVSSYTTANYNALAATHVAKTHPEWMLTSTTSGGAVSWILDPGIPDVRTYVNNVVMDIVNRYDIDGIHFDDYFYPNATYNDDATFTAYPNGFSIRADWRRNNVNLLIQMVNNSITAAKPWVKFGVSPSGIWRNGTGVGGSATTGFEHYVTIFADSRRWIQEEWVDYLCPQVYWQIGLSAANYSVLIPWWNNVTSTRHIYIGMAGYKVGVTGNGTFETDNTMIPRELRMNRDPAYPNVYGQSIYNTTSLRNNNLGFRDSMRLFFYNKPALQPTMPWKDNTAPLPASALTASVNVPALSSRLEWTPPATTAVELDKVRNFVVYRSGTSPVDINDANNLLAIVHADSTGYTDATLAANSTYFYLVTAVDRFHNESTASNTVSASTGTLPLQLTDFIVTRFDKNRIQLLWETAHEEQVSHFEAERSLDGSNFTSIGRVTTVNQPGNHTYQLADPIVAYNTPLYYRLRMTDIDGRFRYSPVRTITVNEQQEFVQVVPTVVRAGQPVEIVLQENSNRPLSWVLYDAGGRQLRTGTLSATTAGSRTSLPVTGQLRGGWYLLRFSNGTRNVTARFMVQ